MESCNSSESSKGRRREPSVEKSETKRSRVRSRSNSLEKDKRVPTDSKNVSRKTRWQDNAAESKKVTQPSDNKGHTQAAPKRPLKDLLHDKVALIELIFKVPPEKLESYKGDYMKKYTTNQLKRLCYQQLKMMSDESVLEIVEEYRKKCAEEAIKTKLQAVKTESNADGKSKSQSSVKIEEEAGKSTIAVKEENTESLPSTSSNHGSDSSSVDVLELFATYNDLEGIIKDETKNEENKQTEEENKLQNDAELLELEMRARAIRSLLKAKSLSNAENEDQEHQEGKDDKDKQEGQDDKQIKR